MSSAPTSSSPNLKQLRCSNFDAEKASAFPELTELVVYAMKERISENLPDMLLPRLKRLMILGIDDDQIRGFLLANAGNLEFLSVRSFQMRFEPEVVFDQVVDLECRSIHVDTIEAFPAIRHLLVGIKRRGEFLKHLPAAQMLSLQIELGISEEDDDEDEEGEGVADHDEAYELEPCVAAISGMRHLKELEITVNSLYSQKRPDLSHDLSGMFPRTA